MTSKYISSSEFYLLRTLGSGGFSSVYYIEDKNTGERLAMKRCLMKRNEQRVEHLNEIQIARLMSGSKNVLQYKGFKQSSTHMYYFMQMCPSSLDQVIDAANEMWPVVSSQRKLDSQEPLSPKSFHRLMASNKQFSIDSDDSDGEEAESTSSDEDADQQEKYHDKGDEEDDDNDDEVYLNTHREDWLTEDMKITYSASQKTVILIQFLERSCNQVWDDTEIPARCSTGSRSGEKSPASQKSNLEPPRITLNNVLLHEVRNRSWLNQMTAKEEKGHRESWVKTYLLSEVTLREQVASYISRRILLGLRDLHAQGIVHADLKPGNVLIDLYQSPPDVKLIDFNISKRISRPFDADQLPTEITCPLEFFQGRTIYHHGVDTWAVGCVLGSILIFKDFLYNRSFTGDKLNTRERTDKKCVGWAELTRGKLNEIQSFYRQRGFSCSGPLLVKELRQRDIPYMAGLSDECVDFLAICFNPDAVDRPSVFELLKHPFIVKHATPGTGLDVFADVDCVQNGNDAVGSGCLLGHANYMGDESQFIKHPAYLSTVNRSLQNQHYFLLSRCMDSPQATLDRASIIKETCERVYPYLVKSESMRSEICIQAIWMYDKMLAAETTTRTKALNIKTLFVCFLLAERVATNSNYHIRAEQQVVDMKTIISYMRYIVCMLQGDIDLPSYYTMMEVICQLQYPCYLYPDRDRSKPKRVLRGFRVQWDEPEYYKAQDLAAACRWMIQVLLLEPSTYAEDPIVLCVVVMYLCHGLLYPNEQVVLSDKLIHTIGNTWRKKSLLASRKAFVETTMSVQAALYEMIDKDKIPKCWDLDYWITRLNL